MSSFLDNAEARAMGREDLSAYKLTNGLYIDPNESEEDDDNHVGSFHVNGGVARKMSRSVSSPNMGPKAALSPTTPHVMAPLKLDDQHRGTDVIAPTAVALRATPTSPINNLPDAIMAAFNKLSPSMVPLSPTSERKLSSSMYIGDTNIVAPPRSVFINSPLAPPPFASLTICENCKVEVGTLLSKPRHHCRNCGGTFCQACSTKSSVIPYEALMSKGEFRVCDCCFLKIREFQGQTGTTQCSWNGLSPMSDSAFLAKFGFPDAQTPVVIVSCCYFPECVPYYGHLYLTREHVCFYAYKSTLAPICIPYEDVAAVVKPEFYFINALQLKSNDKSWFFAEFNGQRDMSYSRLDQLLSAHRQQYKESDHTPELLKEMASQRRQSYLNSNQRKNSVVRDDDDFVPLPPDETLSKMTKILDTELQSDVHHLYDTLFSDSHGLDFYQRVMVSTKDIDISIGAWQPIAQCPFDAMSSLCVSKEPMTHFRKVESKHPPKVTFPGLPPYAECTRYQLCRHEQQTGANQEAWTRFVLAETLRMKKIPYADYFEIETRWVFTLDGNKFCHAEVGIIVHFIKSTWFNNQIISSTISESKEAFETWANAAVAELRQKSPAAASTPPKHGAATDASFQAKSKQPATTSPSTAASPTDTPLSAPATSASSVATSALNAIAQGVRQQPLWAFTVLMCLYMLYALHTMHSTMRLALQRSSQLEERLLQWPSRNDEVEAVVAAALKQLQLCSSPSS